jgi:hypothetical protein
LLEQTLVLWGGEIGRTPMGEVRENVGRNHHIDAFTLWLAGGGIQPGVNLGSTDELSFAPVEDRVHVHEACLIFQALDGIPNRERRQADGLAPIGAGSPKARFGRLLLTLMRYYTCAAFFMEPCRVRSSVFHWAHRWNGS